MVFVLEKLGKSKWLGKAMFLLQMTNQQSYITQNRNIKTLFYERNIP